MVVTALTLAGRPFTQRSLAGRCPSASYSPAPQETLSRWDCPIGVAWAERSRLYFTQERHIQISTGLWRSGV